MSPVEVDVFLERGLELVRPVLNLERYLAISKRGDGAVEFDVSDVAPWTYLADTLAWDMRVYVSTLSFSNINSAKEERHTMSEIIVRLITLGCMVL